MTADVLVLGGAGFDTTVHVPELPLPHRDTYPVPPVIDRIGNTGSGVGLGCAALGLDVACADLIGDDPQGALVPDALRTRGGEVRAFPAAPLSAPVADSNGAGDAFVSGFLYGTLKGLPLERCVTLGAVAGAHACTVPGTHESPITEATLLARTHA